MVRRHNSREYSNHKKHTIRPFDEYYKVEIISFEHDLTKVYLVPDIKKKSNTKKKGWKSWSTFVSKDKKNEFTFSVDYYAKIKGEYRIDIVYEIFEQSNLSGEFMGKSVKFEGSVNHVKRKTFFKQFKKGTHTIDVEMPKNCYFYGLIVRKTKEFVGDSLNSVGTNITLLEVDESSSSQINPVEASFSIAYNNDFEYLASPTGLYMDYNDEVNIYMKKENAKKTTQVFGGYLSNISANQTKTTLQVSCADRMVDGQNRYILTQMRLLGGATQPADNEYTTKMDINFDTYGEALKYLCNCLEISLKNNIGKNNLVTGETAKKGFNIEFGKKKQITKLETKNATAKASKNFITLRNENEGNSKQEIILYLAKDHAKVPPEITDYNNFGIVYGMGDPKVTYTEKVTTSTGGGTSTEQKFNKCGVSADGKYLMAIGLPSAGRDSSSGWTKAVFERKCPHCGSSNMIWDIWYSGGSECLGHGGEGGSDEGHIFCKSCDADYSVQGWEHINGSGYRMKPVSSIVASSRSEASNLKAGKVVAVPNTAQSLTAGDIFKEISNYAFSHFRYSLHGNTQSTASGLIKHGVGDCWAFSEWIYNQLVKHKVNCKVVQYHTSESNQHRSVMYQDKNRKWVDFPYREYGWGSKYNNMLNNTSGSQHPDTTPFKYLAGGTIAQATSGGGGSTTTETVTVTKGYDRDKPIQGYFEVTVSTDQSFDAKTKTIEVGFTQKTANKYSLTGFSPIWINNTTRQANIDLLSFIKKSVYREDITGEKKYYLQSIKFIAPQNKSVDTEKTTDPTKPKYKYEDWYTYDKSTHDNSSCKMDIYSMNFNNSTLINPTDLGACGKSVNTLFEELLTSSKYTASRTYGKHRKDDVINFAVDNKTEADYIAMEGDENNILEITGLSFAPRTNLFNNSTVVFKDSSEHYKYIDTRAPISIMKYMEQINLITSNEKIGTKEAYYNALNNPKYNPNETFTFTLKLPYFVPLQVGDLVQVIADRSNLNTLKTVASVKYKATNTQIPKIQTEIGLGELPVDMQIRKELQEIRKAAKKETTSFSSTAMPITDEAEYVWDN